MANLARQARREKSQAGPATLEFADSHGQRESVVSKHLLEKLNGATGASDMAGNAARVAVERCGSCRDTNAEMGDAEKRNACWRSPAMPLVIRYWLLDQYAKRSRAVLQLPAPFFKNTRARLRYSCGA